MTKTPQEIHFERKQKMQALEAAGWTRKAIAEHEGISRQRVTQILGPADKSENQKEYHHYINENSYEKVMGIAKKLNLFLRSGKNIGKGSVTKLIEQIGEGRLTVVPTSDYETMQAKIAECS